MAQLTHPIILEIHNVTLPVNRVSGADSCSSTAV